MDLLDKPVKLIDFGLYALYMPVTLATLEMISILMVKIVSLSCFVAVLSSGSRSNNLN